MKKYSKPETKIVALSTDILMAISGVFDETEAGDNFFSDFSWEIGM